jgi:hypothetical protein
MKSINIKFGKFVCDVCELSSSHHDKFVHLVPDGLSPTMEEAQQRPVLSLELSICEYCIKEIHMKLVNTQFDDGRICELIDEAMRLHAERDLARQVELQQLRETELTKK